MTRTIPLTFPAAPPGSDEQPAPVQGRLRVPDGETPPARAAVLLHPHPAHGGNMDVWLLATIGERLAEAGWVVLRFNFRSGDEVTARADLAGAIDEILRHATGTTTCALVGWSFGALVGALHGLTDDRVRHWVGIAPPTRPIGEVPMPPLDTTRLADWKARRTVIVGEHDQFYPPATVDVLTPHVVHVVPGADHFLFDRDDEVADLVLTALDGA